MLPINYLRLHKRNIKKDIAIKQLFSNYISAILFLLTIGFLEENNYI